MAIGKLLKKRKGRKKGKLRQGALKGGMTTRKEGSSRVGTIGDLQSCWNRGGYPFAMRAGENVEN